MKRLNLYLVAVLFILLALAGILLTFVFFGRNAANTATSQNYQVTYGSEVPGYRLVLNDRESFLQMVSGITSDGPEMSLRKINVVLAKDIQTFNRVDWNTAQGRVYANSTGYRQEGDSMTILINLSRENVLEVQSQDFSPTSVFNNVLVGFFCSYAKTNNNVDLTSSVDREVCLPQYFNKEYFLVEKI